MATIGFMAVIWQKIIIKKDFLEVGYGYKNRFCEERS